MPPFSIAVQKGSERQQQKWQETHCKELSLRHSTDLVLHREKKGSAKVVQGISWCGCRNKLACYTINCVTCYFWMKNSFVDAVFKSFRATWLKHPASCSRHPAAWNNKQAWSVEGEPEGKRRPDWLPGSVLNTVQGFHSAISVDSRRRVNNGSTFPSLSSWPLSFRRCSYCADSIHHTIAVVTEGRYLVVLVESVGLAKFGVLMVL